ncbi:MAG: type II toxin-antitoxin system PemK/MazF family toxin [Anaerolineaceae bacterium]
MPFPPNDSRPARVFLVVSRPRFLDADHSTALCVPVYSNYHGLATEVLVGEGEGLKHSSSLQCDLVTSMRRASLTDYVGSLAPDKMPLVNRALALSLGILPEDIADL